MSTGSSGTVSPDSMSTKIEKHDYRFPKFMHQLLILSETSLSIVFLFTQIPDIFPPFSSGRKSGFSRVRLACGHIFGGIVHSQVDT